jgi:hypothetical protein
MPACLPELREMKKEKWLNAFKQSLNRTVACEAIGIARSTLWRWIKDDHNFAEKVMEIEEGLIDEIEGKLLDLARSGNLQAIKTFLKAKAANRGYVPTLKISQTSKHETVDTRRLELLLANNETAKALELIAYNALNIEKIERNDERKK